MMSAFFRAGAGIQKHFFSLNGGRLPADPACVPVAFSSDTKNGLWYPASASALERAVHPADHCPNSNFLFLPLAAVVAVAGHSIARPIAALRQQGPTPADGPQRKVPARKTITGREKRKEQLWIICRM